jgi:CTP synthase
VARTEGDLDARRRDRLALFCNMYGEDVIVNRDLPSIYQVPLEFAKQEFDKKVLVKLGLEDREADLTEWEGFVKKALAKKTKKLTIAIVGKYFGDI